MTTACISPASPSLFDLLLWSQLVCVSTLLFAAIGCTGVQPSIAPASHEATYDLSSLLVVPPVASTLFIDCLMQADE